MVLSYRLQRFNELNICCKLVKIVLGTAFIYGGCHPLLLYLDPP